MTVTKTRFDDSSEPDERGHYGYSYTGVLHDFFDDLEKGFIFRVYDDTPDEASYISSYTLTANKKLTGLTHPIAYNDSFFISVVEYLSKHEGIITLKVLSDSGEYKTILFHK